MRTVTSKVVMMREVHKMMTMNELRIIPLMKYLSLHWMHQGQEPWMPSICPAFGGLSMRTRRGLWMGQPNIMFEHKIQSWHRTIEPMIGCSDTGGSMNTFSWIPSSQQTNEVNPHGAIPAVNCL